MGTHGALTVEAWLIPEQLVGTQYLFENIDKGKGAEGGLSVGFVDDRIFVEAMGAKTIM